jgi:4-hydroxybenzoate polyprenyltransferase
MPDLSFLLKVSRPRFWIYVFGPYLIGLAAGAPSRGAFVSFGVAAFAVFFLLPANLLIYGINDIFDFETDKLNPKKQEYEMLVRPAEHRGLAVAIVLLNLPFIIGALFMNAVVSVSMIAFLFLSVFYSAPPFRAKAIPIVDSMFNALYVMPGILGYGLMFGELPPASAIVAAVLWTMAMHAYSAIPDIQADREAKVETVATLLRREGTLLYCSACYLLSAVLAFRQLGVFAGVLGMVYLGLMAASILTKQTGGVYRIYRYFPVVNSACGFVLFWYAAVQNLFIR